MRAWTGSKTQSTNAARKREPRVENGVSQLVTLTVKARPELLDISTALVLHMTNRSASQETSTLSDGRKGSCSHDLVGLTRKYLGYPSIVVAHIVPVSPSFHGDSCAEPSSPPWKNCQLATLIASHSTVYRC